VELTQLRRRIARTETVMVVVTVVAGVAAVAALVVTGHALQHLLRTGEVAIMLLPAAGWLLVAGPTSGAVVAHRRLVRLRAEWARTQAGDPKT
jgi:hypothetical protein